MRALCTNDKKLLQIANLSIYSFEYLRELSLYLPFQILGELLLSNQEVVHDRVEVPADSAVQDALGVVAGGTPVTVHCHDTEAGKLHRLMLA